MFPNTREEEFAYDDDSDEYMADVSQEVFLYILILVKPLNLSLLCFINLNFRRPISTELNMHVSRNQLTCVCSKKELFKSFVKSCRWR